MIIKNNKYVKCLQSNTQRSTAGHLLILGCSDRKIRDLGRAPALEIYDGPNYRVLRKFFRENGWPPGLMVKIISAEHEIIDAMTSIDPYDVSMDKKKAEKMNLKVRKNLRELGLPESVFVNLGKDYLPAISCITTLFNPDKIIYAEGGIGKKQQAMKQWLHDLPNYIVSVNSQEQLERRPYLYFFPDWDDYIYEPFNPDETPEYRQSKDVKKCYAHEIFGKETPYDGLLYSLAQLRTKMGPLNRLYRKESFDFRGEMRVPVGMLLFGDCGAFSYATEHEPHFTSAEAASLYNQFGFDFGASVDHIPQPSMSEKEIDRRMELTEENAKEFLEIHRDNCYKFIPIGSIQGITPKDYARFTREYVDMGYKHIALGGLVRRKDSEILEIVASVRKALQQYTRGKNENIWVHLFGILRPNLQPIFQSLGISSFDSASYMRTAWTSSTKNYFAADGSWYGSIRVPISTSKRMRDAAESHATISNEYMQELEKKCLVSLERFDRKEIGAQEVLDSINEYNTLLQRKGTYNRFSEKYEELLEKQPWKKCRCKVCKDARIDIVIFRGANRNRRRGFHNTWVFYHKILHKGSKKSSRKSDS